MNIRSEQGIAAIGVVVMLLVVLSLLATALWQYSMFQIKAAQREKAYLQALYLAHAGAEAAKAAWLDKGAETKLEGQLARVYYNDETNGFQLNRPESYLGFIDIVIETVTDEGEDYRLTKIISTATVGGVSRSVTLTTYPQRYGHQDPLNLYNENTGQISGSNLFINEYLIVETFSEGSSLHFGSSLQNQNAHFSARAIAFETSIDLARGGTASWTMFFDWVLGHMLAKTLSIEAEYVFFKDIALLYAQRNNDLEAPQAQYSIVLRIPQGRGIELNGQLYGEVYFEGESVYKQQFKWDRGRGLFADYTLSKSNSEAEELQTYEGVPLAGNAFYFRDGTDLLNPKPGQLIPIPEEQQNKHDAYRDMFIWE